MKLPVACHTSLVIQGSRQEKIAILKQRLQSRQLKIVGLSHLMKRGFQSNLTHPLTLCFAVCAGFLLGYEGLQRQGAQVTTSRVKSRLASGIDMFLLVSRLFSQLEQNNKDMSHPK
jgi:hypothetical protein